MARDERQDVNKLRKDKGRVAGSDLPPRGKGVKDVKITAADPAKTAEIPKPKPKPKGYKGSHRDQGGRG